MQRALIWVAALMFCVPAAAAVDRADLSGVKSWCYWLQSPDIQELSDSDYDLVVMDYSYDGSEAGEFSHADIKQVRDAGKTVLAYFSIGEAEDYRFYWKSNWRVGKPRFIAEENPDWEGNYKVKYWARGWWNKALKPYLDRILAQGFDGVYLDIVDGYWWWHEERGINVGRCANRMAKLVEKIANYARERAGADFIVCPQNAVSLLDDASSRWRKRYLASVDAVGVESLYYNYWTAADKEYRLEMLEQFDAAGKKILVAEYIDQDDWEAFFAAITASGMDMIGYPAAPDQALDELIDAP